MKKPIKQMAEPLATSHQPKGMKPKAEFIQQAALSTRHMVAYLVMVVLLSVSSAQAAHFNYRVIAPEMVGEDVYYLQSFLSQLGLYTGKITERYDYLTQDAVKLFQRRYRLPDTGWVDSNTAKALLSAINQEVNLTVDGQYQLLTPPPKMIDDVCYISIEAAMEIFGIGVKISEDGVELLFRHEVWPLSLADQNGLPAYDEAGRATARPYQGTLYLPLRSLASWVGATVDWDTDTRTATIVLPTGHRPYQATGLHYLRRTTAISYPDRVRLIFHLASTKVGNYVPRALIHDSSSGSWQGQLDQVTITGESQEIILNDPTVRLVRLNQAKGSLLLTVIPKDGQPIASCEWLLDMEHDRLILDMYRGQ